jgi:hypothetical protein
MDVALTEAYKEVHTLTESVKKINQLLTKNAQSPFMTREEIVIPNVIVLAFEATVPVLIYIAKKHELKINWSKCHVAKSFITEKDVQNFTNEADRISLGMQWLNGVMKCTRRFTSIILKNLAQTSEEWEGIAKLLQQRNKDIVELVQKLETLDLNLVYAQCFREQIVFNDHCMKRARLASSIIDKINMLT